MAESGLRHITANDAWRKNHRRFKSCHFRRIEDNKMNRKRTVIKADGTKARIWVRTLPNASFTKTLKLRKKRMENLYGKKVKDSAQVGLKTKRDRTGALNKLKNRLYKI